ncbi:MAG: integrin alpha, partial [Bacteroidota bacterium]
MSTSTLPLGIFFLFPLFLVAQTSNGTVVTSQVIASNQGDLVGPLQSYDAFGRSIATIGDLDGDGIDDIAVGAPGRSSNSPTDGAVWILFLNPNGTVKAEQQIAENVGGFTGSIMGQEAFGNGLAYLGDLDGDNRPELAVGAPGNTDASGFNPADSGAVFILSLNTDGTVHDHTLISHNSGGLVLDYGDHFGYSVANAGDLDGDGRPELAVGSWGFNASRGALHILFLNADGTVNSFQRISETEGNFNRVLTPNDHFGCSIALLDDINGDERPDLAVGAYGSDQGGAFRGAVWFLQMQADGTVNTASSVINGSHPQLQDTLSDFDYFGWSVSQVGDLDGDGRGEVAVGAPRTNTLGNGSGEGRLYLLFTGGYGILRGFATISEDDGNLNQALGVFAGLGSALASPGDLDGDGIDDLWAGVYGYNGGVSGTGGIFRLTLEGKGEAQLQGRAMVYPDGLTDPVSAGRAYLFDLYDE